MDVFPLIKRYLAPHRNSLLIITGLILVCGLFEVVSLGTLVPLIDIIGNNQEPTGNLWNLLKSVFGLINVELNFTTLLIALSGFFLVGQVLVYIRQKMQINLRFSFVTDIKERIFSHLLHADLSYHYDKKVGNFLDTILVETERAGSGVYVITDLISNSVLILVYVAMLVYISFDLTLICIAVVIVMLFFVNRLLENSKIFGIQCVDSNIEINEYTTERLSLVKLIKTYSNENYESNLFSRIADRFRIVNTKFVINGAKIELLFQSIMFIVAIVIVYLSFAVFNLSMGLIAVFLFILIRLTTPLRGINSQRHELAGLLAGLSKVDQIITESANTTSINDGPKKFEEIREKIQITNVTFTYSADRPVFNDVNLTIKKNDLIAFVGPSGGGKSTLVDLLIRLIEPTSGSIEIDDENIQHYNLRSYHNKIGVVSQDIFIFNESVLYNICYGAGDLSLERAQEAAKIAYAHEFIMALPQGYDTPLGDRGVKLSGGQKQRIALARALCKNPAILILDEATSALDTESEKIIQNSINAIKHKYTIIVVAHRISTIENADKIFVIEEGRIMESGSHQELLLKNGTVRKILCNAAGKQRYLNH